MSWQIFPIQWWFYRFLFLQLNTLRAYHLADQVLTDLPPPIKWQFHRLLWNSYFIPTLRAHIGRPSGGRSTPCQMAILQIAALTAHISFLLWELIIWQTRSWQIYPPIKWQFHRFLLWQLTTLRAQHLTDQVLADLPPHQMAISQIPLKFIFHSYSESSTFGWPGLGRSTYPYQMAISQIPALLWKLIFVRPSVGRSTPHPPMVISQMLADLPPHQTAISQISALLWELILSRPPCQMVISQIPALTAH